MELIEESVILLKALADNNRLEIINLLSCGKMCVCDLTKNLAVSQPNISHHLKVLKNAGLINGTKRGKWIDYELNQEVFEKLKNNLEDITSYNAQK